MNRSKSHFFCIWAGLSWILLSPFFGIPEPYCSTYPLDEDSVFCAYIMLSGNNINEQDVEELCFGSGKPIYTSFKPSEMFTKQGIIREKNRIIKKIGDIGYVSHFIWEIEAPALYEKKDGDGTRFILNYKSLPQPTHFINSEITKSGKRLLKKAIDDF